MDVQGAATVRRLAPESVSIFMVPGSYEELTSRLVGRMSETSPEMELRLNTAREELSQIQQFDYRVVNRNDCLDQSIAEIDAIIAAEKCRVVPRVVQFL